MARPRGIVCIIHTAEQNTFSRNNFNRDLINSIQRVKIWLLTSAFRCLLFYFYFYFYFLFVSIKWVNQKDLLIYFLISGKISPIEISGLILNSE